MNFSVKSEYALQAVFDLAMQPVGEPVKIADIARRQKIPQKFLELILASLKQGGFVESRRGAEGGYRLAKPSSEITVGSVLYFVEGDKKARRGNSTAGNAPGGTLDNPSGNPAGGTAFGHLWRRVDDAVASILDHTTFADMVRQWKESQGRYVANWEI